MHTLAARVPRHLCQKAVAIPAASSPETQMLTLGGSHRLTCRVAPRTTVLPAPPPCHGHYPTSLQQSQGTGVDAGVDAGVGVDVDVGAGVADVDAGAA